jgi:hypothetical protein
MDTIYYNPKIEECKMPRRKWTEELFDVIREKAQNMTDETLAYEIMKLTGKTMTLGAVRKMRQRIGVKKVGGRVPHVVATQEPLPVDLGAGL